MINKIKYSLYNWKEWLKRLYVYPQETIGVDNYFDYDSYWKERRGEYMGRLGFWQAKRANLAATIILNHGGESVNDIGSGAGEVLRTVKEKAGLKSAVAFDSSPYALEIAKSIGLETELFDVNEEKEFGHIREADFTLLFEILEHIPGSEALLKKSFDSSKKGVLFSFPNTGFFIHRFRLFFFGKFPLQWTKHPREHLRFWTKPDLIWWLNAQGYKKFKIHYYVGIPILKDIWPNMFAAGFFVEILK